MGAFVVLNEGYLVSFKIEESIEFAHMNWLFCVMSL